MRFYLAGGMRGTWQDKVTDRLAFSGHQCINPQHHGLREPKDYTQWDLGGVAIADGVIAYMTKDNPSGIGLTLEVGMAIGMGKPVYFANEKHAERYWHIVNFAASYCYKSLDALLDGIERQALPGLMTPQPFRGDSK